jgi:N-methylhydantoinase B
MALSETAYRDVAGNINGIELSVYSGKLNSVCEEMGYVLQRSSVSPNIKDRLDFSCAVFDEAGRILAQAAHIPVHLGSMAYAMLDLVSKFSWSDGDMVVLNDPFSGGTHLPDVTLVAPIFVESQLIGFVANRAHHADIGASAPGSMPLSRSLVEEGLIIKPQKLIGRGDYVQDALTLISSISRDLSNALPEDFHAQISANRVGLKRIIEWLKAMDDGCKYFSEVGRALNRYGSQIMCSFIGSISASEAVFEDFLDEDGFGSGPIVLRARIQKQQDKLIFDFTGSAPQVAGNLNCPITVTAAAAYYLVVCLLPRYAPQCHGVFQHIEIKAPEGSILNAAPGAAVAAGNVETSMRVVDVVQGALGRLGLNIPAASQGTMNNVAMGGRIAKGSAVDWDYYETLGGGAGAHSKGHGLSGVQCHMTNTLNTPIESLEMHYPLLIKRYALARGTGGNGEFKGGDGLIREYEFLSSAELTLLTERRTTPPWGLNGKNGQVGRNLLNGEVLQAKASLNVSAGDVLSVQTPGGGAWSSAQ